MSGSVGGKTNGGNGVNHGLGGCGGVGGVGSGSGCVTGSRRQLILHPYHFPFNAPRSHSSP